MCSVGSPENSANFNSISMELDEFLSDQGIDKIYWNREFGLNEERRDDEVKASLKAASYPFYSFNDQILFEPGSLKTQQGGDFSVFTPFKNKWKKEFHNELLPKNFYYRKKNKLNLESNVFTFNFRFRNFIYYS